MFLQVKKVLSRLVTILTVLIFTISVVVFITVIANWGSGVPRVLGYSFLIVRTQSMVPTYEVGSILIVKQAEADTLVPGDVISFYSEDPVIAGTPNTHRIVSVGKNDQGKRYFITKGDNNPVVDSYKVYEDKLIGKVSSSISSAGTLINKLKNRYVIFFLLIVPFAFLTFREIDHIKKLLGEKDEEEQIPVDDSEKTEQDD